MTKSELRETVESFGAPNLPARISELIPDDLPQVVIAGVLFVMCEDGPVCFDIEHLGCRVEVVPGTMKDEPQGVLALWRVGYHNIVAFERALHDWWGE